MAVATHSLSFMLRNSGQVLTEVEHGDVLLSRRDGPDLLLETSERGAAVRDSLSLFARVMAVALNDVKLADVMLEAFRSAVPWMAWLTVEDQGTFARELVATSLACHETTNFKPLVRMLGSWKTTAQIANDPALLAVLAADSGPDEPVLLSRPRD